MPLNARVSIHTPVWGVTVLHGFDADNYIGFNPHARVERDLGKLLQLRDYWVFQSTRPCGA